MNKYFTTLLLCFVSFFCNAQNVGIGIVTPAAPLHIKTTGTEALRVDATDPSLNFYNNTTQLGYLRYTSSTNNFDLATPFLSNRNIVMAPNQLPLAYFAGNAKVGIGGLPVFGKLDIYSNGSSSSPQLSLVETSNDYSRLMFKNNINPFYWLIEARNNASLDFERLRFYNSTTGDIMNISGTGNVGIGKVPEVNKRFEVFSSGGYNTYLSSSNGADTAAILVTQNISSNPTFLSTGIKVDQLVIDGRGVGMDVDAGYVGAFFSSVDVNFANQNYGIIATTNSDGNSWGVYGNADNGGVVGGTHIGVYGTATGGITNWAFYGTGNAFLSGGTWQSSDEKLKMNIAPLINASQKLKQLQSRSYFFKSNSELNLPEEKQFGFLAGEVEQIFPNLVKEVIYVKPLTDPSKPSEETKFKAINYTGFIPVLAEAINEHTADIEALKKENAELKKIVQQLLMQSKK